MHFKKHLGFYLRILTLLIVILEIVVTNLAFQKKLILLSLLE